MNNIISKIIEFGEIADHMKKWRHAIHKHPETAYEEFNTAKLVSSVLREHGIEIHESIATTGIVGVIRSGTSNRAIGLRADLDALDLDELNQFEHRSQIPGKMHACGHDGHTSMLLGAACYLAKNRDFDGTIYVIFQPAEEIEGGAKQMIKEGLFERFPMDAVFGMHNMPMQEAGSFAICPGPMMAAFATFECTITGKGMHSSMPHLAIDPIEIATEIIKLWKTITQKDVDPLEPSVISITQFNSGTTQNISPEIAVLKGSTRCFSSEVAKTIETRMNAIANTLCKDYGAICDFNYKQAYPTLVNEVKSSSFAADVAVELVGEEKVSRNIKPSLSSEDFACMLEEKIGAYIFIGNGLGEEGGCMIHNPNYDFNDDILEIGGSYWVNLAKSFLKNPYY